MTVSAIKIIEPGEIQGLPDKDMPQLVVPSPKHLFAERASRLEYLAKDGELKGWLEFCAMLAKAQSEVIDKVSVASVDDSLITGSLKNHIPPLSISTWKVNEEWSTVYQKFTEQLATNKLPQKATESIAAFSKLSPDDQAKQVIAFLNADEASVRPEYAPFIGAALQLIWTKRAEQLAAYTEFYKGESSLCPVCGSHPIASVVRTGDRDANRFMACSLCASEWYGPRARCTNCETPIEVSILGESQEDSVQGECCDECHGYLKLMLQSKDPMMEVMADDLATIGLDIALSNEGFQRTGRNMYFLSGGEQETKTS
jgi:FdhE protein